MVEAQIAPPKTVFQKELKPPFYKLRFIGGTPGSRTYLGTTYRNAEFQENANINDILYANEDLAFRMLKEHPDAFVNLGKGEGVDIDSIQREREAFLEKTKEDVLGEVGEDKIVTPETKTIAVISASNKQLNEFIESTGLKLPKGVKTRAEIEEFLKKENITEIEI